MKGSTGTATSIIVHARVKKKPCDCKKCYNYLKTNPLCRLGRKTPQKYCKWDSSNPKVTSKQTRKINKLDKKEVDKCIKCKFIQEGFCTKFQRFASNARKECI